MVILENKIEEEISTEKVLYWTENHPTYCDFVKHEGPVTLPEKVLNWLLKLEYVVIWAIDLQKLGNLFIEAFNTI